MTNNYIGMAAIALIVLVLLGWTMNESICLKEELTSYQAKLTDLERDLEEEEQRTRQLKELEEYMQTDQYAEDLAREKLGLVKENEIVFEELK